MHELAIVVLALTATCTSSKPADPPAPVVAPTPTPTPTPTRSAVLQIAGPKTFTGLSKDGKRFAWLAPSTAGIVWLKIAELDKSEPALKVVDNPDDPEIKTMLADFSPDRKPAGSDLVLQGEITASPPTLAIVRGARSVVVPIGPAPYEPTDAAEIWGVSVDGKYLAIHIAGKDVPGVLSKGGGADFHTFFVVAAP